METNQKLAALQAVVEGMLGSAVDCGTYFKVDSDDITVLRAAIIDLSKEEGLLMSAKHTPELLNAVKVAKEWLERFYGNMECTPESQELNRDLNKVIDRAIAKAEGGE